jgi:hypothetical protein
MTNTAFDIHRVLVEEEGYDPKSDEYYDEVDRRIRVDFGHKFDKMDGNFYGKSKTCSERSIGKTFGHNRTQKYCETLAFTSSNC